jgi:hypothetical protein
MSISSGRDRIGHDHWHKTQAMGLAARTADVNYGLRARYLLSDTFNSQSVDRCLS